VSDLETLLLPAYPDARAGAALPPCVQPEARPATPVRRRVRQLARLQGLVEVPRTYSLLVASSGGGVLGLVDFKPGDDDGPIIITGIDGLDTAQLISAGTVSVVVKVGDRTYTAGTVFPGASSLSSLLAAIDPSGELPAPIILARGERLAVELLVTGGALIAQAQLRLRALVLRNHDRSPASAPADNVAEKLRDEGELFVLAQRIASTTFALQDQFRATYTHVWHGGRLTGLSTATGTFKQTVAGSDLIMGNASASGLSQLPATTTSLLVLGDVTLQRGELFTASLAGGNVDPGVTGNTVDGLWVGRVFR
jgi:hypothetical protein